MAKESGTIAAVGRMAGRVSHHDCEEETRTVLESWDVLESARDANSEAQGVAAITEAAQDLAQRVFDLAVQRLRECLEDRT